MKTQILIGGYKMCLELKKTQNIDDFYIIKSGVLVEVVGKCYLVTFLV